MKTIGLLGDSIAAGFYDDDNQGWFGRLSARLAADQPKAYGFYNMAMDGDRSSDLFHRFHAEALTREIEVLLIACGINDLVRWHEPEAPTNMSAPLSQEMWCRTLENARRSVPQILIVGLIPVIEARFPALGWFDAPLYHKNADILPYNDMLAALAEEYGATFINPFPVFEAYQPLETLYHNGSHPNGTGHQLLADTVFDKLEELAWLV